MHDAAFADATRPTPVVVLHYPLRDYSIGHELLLQRLGNPLVEATPDVFASLGEPEQRTAVYQAALICHNTWAQNQKPERWLKLFQWVRRHDPIAPAVVAFREYRNEAMLLPRVKCAHPEEPGRIPGAPFLARVVLFLVTEMRLTEEQAFDTGMRKACFYYFSYAESQGGIHILNDDDFSFEEYCAREDAKAEAMKAAQQQTEVANA